MSIHSNYWSCSKFADWVRGIPKLSSGSGTEWKEWRNKSKQLHPVRFWIAEELLDKIQTFVNWPREKLYGFKYHINNRFVVRTHALTADPKHLSRGTWHDLSSRFLPCMFGELVNFVEIELAWFHIAWDADACKKYLPPFWARGWFKISTWRCPEAGIENLEQQMMLVYDENWGVMPSDPDYGKPTDQAIRAKEVLDLYKWWKEVYPKRPDPYDASGWSNYCDLTIFINEDESWLSSISDTKTLKDQLASRDILKNSQDIESAYEKEDEQMMIRLIRVRRGLWT